MLTTIFSKYLTKKIVLASVISIGMTGIGHSATCNTASAKLSTLSIDNFAANPSELLNEKRHGGLSLSNTVVALATSETTTLDILLDLVDGANAKQKSAIGAGLARAAIVCLKQQPDFVEDLKVRLASLDDGSLLPSYYSAINNIPGLTSTDSVALGVDSQKQSANFINYYTSKKHENVSRWRETRPWRKRWRRYWSRRW